MTEFDDRLAAIKARAEAATYLGGEAQEVADDALWLHEQVERLSAAVEAVRVLHVTLAEGEESEGVGWIRPGIDCAACWESHPCPTRRALDAHLPETKEGER